MGRHDDESGPDGRPDGIADYAQAHPYVGPDAVITAPPPDPRAVDGVVDDGSTPVPLKVPGEPMRYRRDVPWGDEAAIRAEVDHVREHLAMIADTDDDPTTHADDVIVSVQPHVDGDPSLVSIIGELDAEPSAPYLDPHYDPNADDDGTRFTRYSEEGRE